MCRAPAATREESPPEHPGRLQLQLSGRQGITPGSQKEVAAKLCDPEDSCLYGPRLFPYTGTETD
jgi:hypothetical protein